MSRLFINPILYALDHLIALLTEYKYFILFPLAIVEGPILAVIAGFLCTMGLLNPLIVFPVIVLGDVIGDSCCYILGRFAGFSWFKKLDKLVTPDILEKTERFRVFFLDHPVRSISLSKITLGIGVAGIFVAGRLKIPYRRFIAICLLASSVQYIVYLSVGFLFGNAYLQINHYLNYLASILILAAIAVLLFISVKKLIPKR